MTGKGFKMAYETITSQDEPLWSYNSGSCGGHFTTSNGLLNSPSYPENYPPLTECIYTISQPNGTRVNMTILNMDIEKHSNCGWDYLEIRDGSSEASPLIDMLCGDSQAFLQSNQSNVWIR